MATCAARLDQFLVVVIVCSRSCGPWVEAHLNEGLDDTEYGSELVCLGVVARRVPPPMSSVL